MKSPASWSPYRLTLGMTMLGFAAVLVALLSGCVHPQDQQANGAAPIARAGYVVRFHASRLKDHTTLAVVSVPLRLGQNASVRTDPKHATEDRPALPTFAATLTRTNPAGGYQLVTKVAIREAARNKKGKLKVSKRNQGALLPIRLGETQTASPADDPIQVDVQVDHR